MDWFWRNRRDDSEERERAQREERERAQREERERAQREERERAQREERERAQREERYRKEREERERAKRELNFWTVRNKVEFESNMHHFGSSCRDVRICQETGILCYDALPADTPLGQFIAPKPLSGSNSICSLTILASGTNKSICIGLVPKEYMQKTEQRWVSRSIFYQADTGGIFTENGNCYLTEATCEVGDVMGVEIDEVGRKGWFHRSGIKVHEFDLSKFDLYPCVCLHSKGEAVKLNEINIWTADSRNNSPTIQNDFRTYKYDNLCISEMIYVMSADSCSGWVILYNSKLNPVGYKVTIGTNVHEKIGQLKHKEHFLDFVQISGKDNLEQINQAKVEWIQLESGRQYDDTDLENSLAKATDHSSHMLDVELVYSSQDMPWMQELREKIKKEMQATLAERERQLRERVAQLRDREQRPSRGERISRE